MPNFKGGLMKKFLLVLLFLSSDIALAQSNVVEEMFWNPLKRAFTVFSKGGVQRDAADYEEAAFTPSLRTTGGTFTTVTYTVQTGYSIRVGSMVHTQMYLAWSAATGTPAGIAGITLPVTQTSRANTYSTLACDTHNMDLTGTTVRHVLNCQVAPNFPGQCVFEEAGDNVGSTNPPYNIITDGTSPKYIICSGTYTRN